MKHCPDHLSQIIDALKVRDLWRHVPTDKAGVVNSGLRWLLGRCRERADVNPMAVVVYEIYQRAATRLPAYVQDPHYEYCPLCEAVHVKGDGTDAAWVNGYADAAKQLMVTSGLIKA